VIIKARWLDIPTSLIAAGIHNGVMPILASFGYELGSRYLTLFPTRFFAGWALMFLPGAVAAHDYAPMPREQVGLRRQIVGCCAPAVAGSGLFLLIIAVEYLIMM
jgi:hypothetical protein